MCDKSHLTTILINNLKNYSTLSYSVAFLEGEITTPCETETVIFHLKQGDYIHSTATTLKQNNKFKHLIELFKGENEIEIFYCRSTLNITLYYKAKITDFCVVPVYIVCKNHDGTFDSPQDQDNSIDSACKKIVTGTKLIQLLLAEKFNENGMNRKTFQLESEIFTDVPECRVHYSNLDVDKVRQMKQDELWYTFGRELMNSNLRNEKFKYLAFLSCTRYRGDKYDKFMTTHTEIVSITEAHAALGGGGLAIFGSACLHTWPIKIRDYALCFENHNIIDKNQLMDDSCYRSTYSGCFATTLGAVCHELCHTFDLGHTESGIMARGFDKINEEFIITKPKPDNKIKFSCKPPEQHCTVAFTRNLKINVTENSTETKILDKPATYVYKKVSVNKEGIYFTRNCLMLLYYHRWFNKVHEDDHFLKYEDNKIFSTAGICIIEIRNENTGMVLDWWDFSEKPVDNFKINKSNLYVKYKNQQIMFVAEDIVGNIIKFKI